MTAMDRRNNTIAGTGTVAVWLVLFIIFFAAGKFPHKPAYKTVKIQLEAPSTPKIAEKQEAAPPKAEAAAQTPSAPPPPAPAAPAKAASKPVTKQPAKPAAKPDVKAASVAKPAPKPAAKPAAKPAQKPQQLTKSVEERMAEMNSKPKPKKSFDWSQFDDDAVEVSSSSSSSQQTTASIRTQDVFEGSAASASKGTSSSPVTSASSSVSKNNSTSSSTTAALGAIAASNYKGTAGNGVTSTSNVKTASSPDGKIAMYMNDGSKRVLLEPAKPVINLTPEASVHITSSVELTITFTITKDGRVPVTSVNIPKALANQVVRDQIAQQVSQWRFDSASYESMATFVHKIVKQ